MATLHLLVATNGRIRDSYRYRDELSGQLIREMQRTGRKDIVGYGHRARLVPHKPTGSPSERRRWRRVYGPTAYDLKITKLEAKAA
jgi:hypothetical protein